MGAAPPSSHDAWAPFVEGLESDVRVRVSRVQGYRFIGDRTSWQQKNGQQKMTAVKEYVVELKTAREEHFLVKMRLVYDWLLYCHLVATVELFAMSSQSAFPGAEDIALDI